MKLCFYVVTETIMQAEHPWCPRHGALSSYVAMERLQAAINHPDDQALLLGLNRQNINHKEASLSTIWVFSMTKGGAMDQKWHLAEPWQPLQLAEDHPDGFFPDVAYERLEDRLEGQDRTRLRDLLQKNVRMGYRDARVRAMCDFARAKAGDSSRQWWRELEAEQEREAVRQGLKASWDKWTGALLRRRMT